MPEGQLDVRHTLLRGLFEKRPLRLPQKLPLRNLFESFWGFLRAFFQKGP
jgi:hypothetical protein